MGLGFLDSPFLIQSRFSKLAFGSLFVLTCEYLEVKMLNRRLLVARYLMATRPIHANFKWPPEIKFKWEKNPKGPKMPGTHLRLGDPEDPELNQFDTEVNIYPEKGDKDIPRDLYRECKPQQWDFYVDRVIGRIIVGGFWAWVFYNLYWNYQKLTVSFL